MGHEGVMVPRGEPVPRVNPIPADRNGNDDILRVCVMAQVVVADAIPVIRRALGRSATVVPNSFRFQQPIPARVLASFNAHVLRVGKTPITVNLQVHAERIAVRPVAVAAGPHGRQGRRLRLVGACRRDRPGLRPAIHPT